MPNSVMVLFDIIIFLKIIILCAVEAMDAWINIKRISNIGWDKQWFQ